MEGRQEQLIGVPGNHRKSMVSIHRQICLEAGVSGKTGTQHCQPDTLQRSPNQPRPLCNEASDYLLDVVET